MWCHDLGVEFMVGNLLYFAFPTELEKSPKLSLLLLSRVQVCVDSGRLGVSSSSVLSALSNETRTELLHNLK